MSLSKESVRKLKAVKAAILAEPEFYCQSQSPYATNCNTPCCIAGWVAWLDNPDPVAYKEEFRHKLGVEAMQEHLEISYIQAYTLFDSWPEGEEYREALERPGTKQAAIAGAKRIDLFISSGGNK